MVRDRYLEAGSPCGAAYPASTASRFSGEYAIDGSNGSGSRVHPSLRTVRISSGRGRKWAMQARRMRYPAPVFDGRGLWCLPNSDGDLTPCPCSTKMMLNNVIVWDIETVPDLKGFGGAERGSCLAAGRHDGPCAAVGFSEGRANG